MLLRSSSLEGVQISDERRTLVKWRRGIGHSMCVIDLQEESQPAIKGAKSSHNAVNGCEVERFGYIATMELKLK